MIGSVLQQIAYAIQSPALPFPAFVIESLYPRGRIVALLWHRAYHARILLRYRYPGMLGSPQSLTSPASPLSPIAQNILYLCSVVRSSSRGDPVSASSGQLPPMSIHHAFAKCRLFVYRLPQTRWRAPQACDVLRQRAYQAAFELYHDTHDFKIGPSCT